MSDGHQNVPVCRDEGPAPRFIPVDELTLDETQFPHL